MKNSFVFVYICNDIYLYDILQQSNKFRDNIVSKN